MNISELLMTYRKPENKRFPVHLQARGNSRGLGGRAIIDLADKLKATIDGSYSFNRGRGNVSGANLRYSPDRSKSFDIGFKPGITGEPVYKAGINFRF